MRKIKFRQPLFLKEKFLGFHYWGFINDVFIGVIGELKEARETSQQFTGLHDRSGKEIYEGDIGHYGSLTPLRIIKFSNGSLGPNGMSFDENEGEHSNYIKDFEVIGNIYENPELLDK